MGIADPVVILRAPWNDQSGGPAIKVEGPAQKTILLVEDEDNVRAIASRLLGRLGFRVLAAAKPSEAVSLFDQHRSEIDLLLTDVVMPEMNGPSLAQRLRGISPELLVLFMSGYSDVNGAELSGQPHCAFLSKPFSAAALTNAVNDILSRRQ